MVIVTASGVMVNVSVSYFSDFDEGVYGIRIKTSDYNSKILNFIKKKVGDVSVLEESKELARKSIKESKYKVSDFKNTSNKEVSISYVDEDDNPLWVGSPDELEDCDYSDYDVEEVGEEGNTLYLSIEESKKSMRKSIKEAKNITFSDLCDELGISYMDIYAIGYDDGDGISYYCDEMLKVGIKILKNEAIQITGLGTFIGKFNFNDYIKYPTSNTSILLQDKSRLLDIYLK